MEVLYLLLSCSRWGFSHYIVVSGVPHDLSVVWLLLSSISVNQSGWLVENGVKLMPVEFCRWIAAAQLISRGVVLDTFMTRVRKFSRSRLLQAQLRLRFGRRERENFMVLKDGLSLDGCQCFLSFLSSWELLKLLMDEDSPKMLIGKNSLFPWCPMVLTLYSWADPGVFALIRIMLRQGVSTGDVPKI